MPIGPRGMTSCTFWPLRRTSIATGAVAIAGRQTAVYPLAMPGGWHLIGRTDVVLFDPERDSPALFHPGATVRFVPATGP